MPAINRVADQAMHTASMANMGNTSKKIEQNYSSITSGSTFSTYKEAGDNTSRILDLENTLANLEKYEQNETTIYGRLQKTEMIVRQINDIAIDYRAKLTKVTSYGVTDTTFQDYCQKKLEEVQRLLNTQDPDGRYLFGGENTTSAPVDISLLGAPNLGAPVNYNYYKGTNNSLTALIGERQEIQYGIPANSQGLAKLIHSLKIGATTTPNNDANSIEYQKLRNDAMTLTGEAANEIPDILQKVGTTMQVVEQTQNRQGHIKQLSKQILDDISSADYIESLFNLGKNQVALQFSIIAHQQVNDSVSELLNSLRSSR